MYRKPTPPEPEPLDDDEQQLLLATRRRRARIGLIAGVVTIACMATCTIPIARNGGRNLWNGQRTELTSDEAREVNALLDGVDDLFHKNQAAFDAAWPKVRAGQIQPHAELGDCDTTKVPKPSVELDGTDWTFVDVTGTNAHALLAAIPLRTASADTPPTLASTAILAQATELRRQASLPMRRDSHPLFVGSVETIAHEKPHVEVLVLLDTWKDPLRGNTGGEAIAHAYVWGPTKAAFTCTSDASAESTPGLAGRLELGPLRQDLALQLEMAALRTLDPAGEGPSTVIREHLYER